MPTKNYVDIAQFQREFRGDLDRALKVLAREAHQGMHREARTFLHGLTARISKTGSMHKNWKTMVGRVVKPSSESAVAEIKAPGRSMEGNEDAGARAVNAGRIRNHYKKFSRLGGSAKVPRGFIKPAEEYVLSRSEAILSRAVVDAEKALTR